MKPRKSSRAVLAPFRVSGRPYQHEYYGGCSTIDLARSLLGSHLVTEVRGFRTSGIIVEVEAYLGKDDPACHSARGKTKRNEVMFRAAGHCYVYLIYGMYHCVNVVSDPEGIGSAVLIRAVEPLEGVEVMQRRRGGVCARDVVRGPGRLCRAFGISTSFSGEHFAASARIWIEPGRSYRRSEIETSGRVGISVGTEMPLRFFIRGSSWISGRRKA
jgi:DNA-3-methyladenine glycosylase